MPRMTNENRPIAVGMVRAGQSMRRDVARFRDDPSTISSLNVFVETSLQVASRKASLRFR